MTPDMLLQIAAELRQRAAVAASDTERVQLLYLAEEYEVVACAEFRDRIQPFSL